MLKSKIHRATVTAADVAYVGSITVDEALLAVSDILEHEAVHVWDVENSNRFMTYAIAGERGSGVVCVNGAAAHLVSVGDHVIIAAFAEYESEECFGHNPSVVRVDADNRILGEASV
jgi:aspartate 1-decarboxylase